MKKAALKNIFTINLLLAVVVLAAQVAFRINSLALISSFTPAIIGIVTLMFYNADWFFRKKGSLVRFFIVKAISVLANILVVLLFFLIVKDDIKVVLFVYLISYLVNLYLFTYHIAKLNRSENLE